MALLYCQESAYSLPNEKRVALIIGNAEYPNSPLTNPVNDARAVAGVLKTAGFKVLMHENLGQTKMKRAIADFGNELASHDVGLFYYAGHGVQMNGRNYLIPVDSKIQYESDIDVETVDIASVLSKMEGAHNRLNLVILDACRNNPFANNARNLNMGLASINAPSGTLIAYATAPGSVAADGSGENGVYTKYLIKHISKPGLRIEDVFKKVRIDVKNETGDQQTPWESSSLEGDFYFLPGNDAVSANKSEAEPTEIPTPLASDNLNPKLNISHNESRGKSTLNCADLREKETFGGDMGFSDLTKAEKAFLLSDCQ